MRDFPSSASTGTRSHLCFSVDRSTGMPPLFIWSRLRRCLTARARGSTTLSATSTILIRVGSHFEPAPPHASTGISRLTHAARSSTLVSMLSMQSTTKSGSPPRSSSSASFRYIAVQTSREASGYMQRSVPRDILPLIYRRLPELPLRVDSGMKEKPGQNPRAAGVRHLSEATCVHNDFQHLLSRRR